MASTTNTSSHTPNLPLTLIKTTHLLNPTTLNRSPHLPALFTLINKCFNIGHNPPGHSYLPWSDTTRLRKHEQLSEEIGPEGFTFIMLAEDAEGDEKVMATASAKPYTSPKAAANGERSESLFKRQPGTDSELGKYKALPKWEVLVMVVEPELQGRGIAGQLMGMTVEEIKRRCVADPKGKESGKVMLMLSSMQELNETYYAKRGWTTTGVRRFQPGTMGSGDGFGVVEMMKIVDLQEMRFL